MDSDKEKLIRCGKICPYCGRETELIDSAEIYGGVSYGWIYICRPCDAYVGCHRNSTLALGRLANAELRQAKKKAHHYFDQIHKNGLMGRQKSYRLLSEQLNIEKKITHIGMSDVAQCERIVDISINFLRENNITPIEF